MLHSALPIALAALATYLLFSLTAGKVAGDNIHQSLRLSFGAYYIHLHHWIWALALGVTLVLSHIYNPIVLGFCLGATAQGLRYKDRFLVCYKKDKFKKLYSKLN